MVLRPNRDHRRSALQSHTISSHIYPAFPTGNSNSDGVTSHHPYAPLESRCIHFRNHQIPPQSTARCDGEPSTLTVDPLASIECGYIVCETELWALHRGPLWAGAGQFNVPVRRISTQ